MNKFQCDLRDLRAGTLSFDAFASNHRERFQRWAGYFFERYRPNGLDLDDLVQEALLEAWRAVDIWNSSKGSSIDRFVEYRVGERIDREIRRVRGWPKKGRSNPAVQIDSPFSIEIADNRSISPSKRLELERVASTLPSSIERDVAVGVGLGASLRVVAAHLYTDPDKRLEHEFDSKDHAIRKVRKAVRTATKKLESRKVETRVSTFSPNM